MNPALYDSKHDVWSVALYVVSLPGIVCAVVLFVFLPLVLLHLLGASWVIGAALLAPWWFALFKFSAIVKLLFAYLMIVIAVLGWIVLGFGLRWAGVF